MLALAEDYRGAPDPLDPRSAYGQAKRLAEQMCVCAAAKGGLEPVIARAFAFVGPGLPLDAHFAIGNFIRDAAAGREIVVNGDGTPLRSYLYAADLAAWLLTLLVEGRAGEAYNVGSDATLSIADLAREVAALAPGASVTIKGAATPGAPRAVYAPDIGKARALGLDVWTPLDEAIRRTMAFARKPPVKPGVAASQRARRREADLRHRRRRRRRQPRARQRLRQGRTPRGHDCVNQRAARQGPSHRHADRARLGDGHRLARGDRRPVRALGPALSRTAFRQAGRRLLHRRPPHADRRASGHGEALEHIPKKLQTFSIGICGENKGIRLRRRFRKILNRSRRPCAPRRRRHGSSCRRR
jgi:hypothetical protein